MKRTQHLILILIGVFGILVPGQSQNCTFSGNALVVTTAADEGPGSLREAIDCANTLVGADTIVFNISGAGPHVINIGATSNASIPVLTDDSTVIDARTQPGYLGIPEIILDGLNGTWTVPINAIFIQGDYCAVYGLEIRNFPDDGIDLRGADNCIIQDNYIHDNGYEQDFFPGAPGTGPWNGCGIVIRQGSDNNQIDGNIIENNEYCGIIIRSTVAQNHIGGNIPNVIRDNAAGILIGNTATAIEVRRNELICNDTIGIYLQVGANAGILPPVITETTTTSISGTGTEGSTIEVFISDNSTCSEAVCQGSIYLGSTIVTGGAWLLTPPFTNGATLDAGAVVTATMTNLQSNTSAFSECMVVTGVSNCTDENGDIFVSNTNDVGTGSLRAAIECANETPGANTIRFSIPGNGVHTIFVGEDNDEGLPALLDEGTILDATTQSGYGAGGDYSPRIRLDGGQTDWTGPYNAVWVRGDYCEVYGLEIVNFPDDGIDVTAADHVIIGAVNKGNVLYDNGSEIDFWPDFPGTGPWNGCGIVFKLGSSFGIIEGNFVGTNISESISASNELCGIIIQNGGDHNRIENNVVAYHEQGIRVTDGGWFNTITQNSLYCNDSIAIGLSGSANLSLAAPVIDSATISYISGRADSAAIVEVFIAADESCASGPCQGKVYLGTAMASDSVWVLEPPFTSGLSLSETDKITATATDLSGNTSTFSFCKAVSPDIVCNLEISIVNVQSPGCDESNGGFEIALNNGTPPYTVDIGSGPSSQLLYNDLTPGTYEVEVSDANGCPATTTVTIENANAVEIDAVGVIDASCNESNGSMSVIASGGQMPYIYNIGNGPTFNNIFENLSAGAYQITVSDGAGCTAETTTEVGQSGVADIEIVEYFNASCEEANGGFGLDVSGGIAPYSFDVGNGPSSSPIFSNLSGGLYNISVTDAVGCISEKIAFVLNVGEIPVAEYSYFSDGGTVNFSSASIGNGSHFWDFNDGTTSSEINPIHEFETSGDYTVCLSVFNDCGIDASCEVVSVVVPLANVNVGGTIAREDGQMVAQVEVREDSHATQVTQSNGTYIYLDEVPQSDYNIIPYKNINPRNGISTFDLFKINQHLLDVETLDSPYKIIAADINNSGFVSTFDLINLRQLILLDVDTFLNNTAWRFVPENYAFAGPDAPLMENFPESISLNNVVDDHLSENFVAIKVGDVNLSANPLNLIDPQGESQFYTELEWEDAEEIVLRVDLRQRDALSALQGSLRFDPHRLHFLEILPGSHNAPFHTLKNNSQIHFCWYAPDGYPVEDYSFRLRFRKLGTDWRKGFRLTDAIPAYSYNGSGEAFFLQLILPDAKSTSVTVAPNPFRDRTQLYVNLSGTEFADADQRILKIYNAFGEIVHRESIEVRSEQQTINLDLSAFPSGTYIYRIADQRGKLIKQ